MKQLKFLLVCAIIFSACNQSTDKTADNGQTGQEQNQDTALSLNNGAKWRADSITNHNVVRLKTTADMFKVEPFPSINNYQVLGNDLSNDVDTLLQQCKMKGDDHTALHKWLEPILGLSNQLKNETDTAAAKQVFKSVDARIDAYRNYFE
ncbi:MAG: hypothetical protein ABJB05_02285 [Parafilimonas sp.]